MKKLFLNNKKHKCARGGVMKTLFLASLFFLLSVVSSNAIDCSRLNETTILSGSGCKQEIRSQIDIPDGIGIFSCKITKKTLHEIRRGDGCYYIGYRNEYQYKDTNERCWFWIDSYNRNKFFSSEGSTSVTEVSCYQ